MTVRVLLLFLGSVLVAAPLLPQAHAQRTHPPRRMPDSTEHAAHAAAQDWLRQLDTDAWGVAWKEASPLLRDAGAQEQWKENGARARATLGAFRSRRLERAQHRDTLRQGTGGQRSFVLLRYRSEFEAGLYVETVLAVKTEEDWAVAGYEVAPVAASGDRKQSLRPRKN